MTSPGARPAFAAAPAASTLVTTAPGHVQHVGDGQTDRGPVHRRHLVEPCDHGVDRRGIVEDHFEHVRLGAVGGQDAQQELRPVTARPRRQFGDALHVERLRRAVPPSSRRAAGVMAAAVAPIGRRQRSNASQPATATRAFSACWTFSAGGPNSVIVFAATKRRSRPSRRSGPGSPSAARSPPAARRPAQHAPCTVSLSPARVIRRSTYRPQRRPQFDDVAALADVVELQRHRPARLAVEQDDGARSVDAST